MKIFLYSTVEQIEVTCDLHTYLIKSEEVSMRENPTDFLIWRAKCATIHIIGQSSTMGTSAAEVGAGAITQNVILDVSVSRNSFFLSPQNPPVRMWSYDPPHNPIRLVLEAMGGKMFNRKCGNVQIGRGVEKNQNQ